MTHATLLTAAIIFLVIPTVAYGGYFLSAILKRNKIGINFTDYPYAQRLFKAGHSHAGVWLVLSLVALNFIQHTHLSGLLQAILRYSFPLSALITSAGFLAALFLWIKSETRLVSCSAWCISAPYYYVPRAYYYLLDYLQLKKVDNTPHQYSQSIMPPRYHTQTMRTHQ